MEIKEVWKDIKGYEGLYQASNLGNIRTLNYRGSKKIKNLKPTNNSEGYLQIYLSKNKNRKKYLVHRLVAESFIPNPENKPFIDHINTIRNDNRADNLRWVTREENNNNELTKQKNSESHKGMKHTDATKIKMSKSQYVKVVQLTKEDVLIKIWDSIKDASEYGFGTSGIVHCCKNRRKYHRGYKWMYYEDYIKRGEINDENI